MDNEKEIILRKELELSLKDSSARVRAKAIKKILTLKKEEWLADALANNPLLLIDINSKDITKKIIDAAIVGYKLDKEYSSEKANDFLKLLPEDIKENDIVNEKFLSLDINLYNSDNLPKTLAGSKKYAEVCPNKFEDIPEKFKKNPEIINIGLKKAPFDVFKKLSDKDKKNKEYFKIAFNATTVIKYEDVENIREKLLSKTSAKNLVEFQKEILKKSPLLLFKDGKSTILKGNLLNKNNKEIILEQFKNSMKMSKKIYADEKDGQSVFSEFLKNLPKSFYNNETVNQMIEQCQIADINNKGLNKDNSKLYEFIKNADLSKKLNNIELRKVMGKAVSVFPGVLDADSKLTEKIMNDKLLYKAICVDPTYVRLAKKPLNNRQRNAIIASTIKNIANPSLDAEKKKENEAILNCILGNTNACSIKNEKGEAVDIAKNLAGTNPKNVRKAIKLLEKFNPDLLFDCRNNDLFKNKKSYKKFLKQYVEEHKEEIKAKIISVKKEIEKKNIDLNKYNEDEQLQMI